MRIESSQQMFQHLENDGRLTLNREGQLETQSAAGHFFQKIADVFRSLSASGRAALEARNTALRDAMTEMVRRDAMINPAQADIPNPPTPQARRNAFVMNLALAEASSRLPEEARAAARTLTRAILHAQGMPEQGTPASVSRATRDILTRIEQNTVVRDGLRCDYTRDHAQLTPLLNEMAEDIRTEYLKQKGHAITEGIHDSYVKDARRGSVRSINGNPPNAADYEGEFKALIPNEQIRGFLSMMASQAGIEGSLSNQLILPGKAKDHPDFPSFPEMMQQGLNLEVPKHRYDIRVEENGTAHLRLEMDAMLKALPGVMGASVGDRPIALGGGRYTLEMVVDLNQDMTGREIPDFTLVNAARVPIPAAE